MENKEKQLWFKGWFNSPYYHLLYKNRDEKEAELFIDKLIDLLRPTAGAKVLDLACGKGRHSIYLNKKGFDVTGLDLASDSIACASVYQNELLHFYVHDMRKIFRTNYFDVVVNLFTSFGYFQKEKDNFDAISTMALSLKRDGVLVIDFMNAKKVIAQLKHQEQKVVGGIQFNIHKKIELGYIIKQIQFEDKGHSYFFEERVQALELRDFEKYLVAAKLKIVDLYGGYGLEAFDENTSDRLIMIVKK